jgi:N-acetylmuramoyl-L-alanine amidase
MSIIKQDLISSDKYKIKCTHEMKPLGVVIHNTYNQASAKNEIAYMKSNDNYTSFHIAVDDVEAIQAIPFNRNTWNAGDGVSGKGNRQYISIEICYSKDGGEKFVKAEKLASKVVAEICKSYGWGIDKIKAHRDFAKKDCPHRTNMDQFKKMVEAELKPIQSQADIIYRVVVGSYTDKKNADDMVKEAKEKGFADAFIVAK